MTSETTRRQAALAAIQNAEAAHRAASAALDELGALLASVMRDVMPVGSVIDARLRPGMPQWLVQVKTMRGNDRGTRLFRIESPVTVEANPTHPTLSRWTCRATPISEKTGRDMSGAAHGVHSNRSTVVLVGHIVPAHYEDDTSGVVRLLQLVADVSLEGSE